MRSRLLTLVVTAVTAVAFGCDENSTSTPSSSFEIPWQTVHRFDESVQVTFNHIWASSADDVFLAYSLETGNKTSDVRVAHFDGAAWTESSIPWTRGATSIWGSSGDDMYVAAGTLAHFDGVQWAALPLSAFSVTGSSPTNVFVANDQAILQYNGADWDTLRTLNGIYSRLLTASPDGSLFYSTGYGTSVWDGSTWRESSSVTPRSFCPFSVSDAFAIADYGDGAIYHWDGQEWTWQAAAAGVLAIGGTTSTDVYAVGQLGVMFHYDGSHWESRPHVTAHSLYRACSTPTGVALAAGSNKVIWLDGTGSRVLREAVIDYTRFPIAAESSERFMLSDYNSIYRYDFGNWSEAPLPFYAGQARALGGRTMDDMYASLDEGFVAHYDGNSWSRVDSVVVPPNAFWVTPSGIAYSVADGGVFRYDSYWNEIKSASSYFYLIVGDGDAGVIAVARPYGDPEHVTISHFDGDVWKNLPTPSDFVYNMWAGPGMDLYLAEESGLFHLQGNHYYRISEAGQKYDFVFGGSDGRIFAMGSEKMGMFDGVSFQPMTGRGPWDAVQAADGSIIADIGWELSTWVP